MGYWWSNQLNAFSKASRQGDEAAAAARALTASATDERHLLQGLDVLVGLVAHRSTRRRPAKFVNYLANSTEAGDILLADRGVPPNPRSGPR